MFADLAAEVVGFHARLPADAGGITWAKTEAAIALAQDQRLLRIQGRGQILHGIKKHAPGHRDIRIRRKLDAPGRPFTLLTPGRVLQGPSLRKRHAAIEEGLVLVERGGRIFRRVILPFLDCMRGDCQDVAARLVR